MPTRFVNIDSAMILLNATSVTALALTWMTEHLSSTGGFIVMVSIAFLNTAKGIAVLKGKKIKQDGKD